MASSDNRVCRRNRDRTSALLPEFFSDPRRWLTAQSKTYMIIECPFPPSSGACRRTRRSRCSCKGIGSSIYAACRQKASPNLPPAQLRNRFLPAVAIQRVPGRGNSPRIIKPCKYAVILELTPMLVPLGGPDNSMVVVSPQVQKELFCVISPPIKCCTAWDAGNAVLPVFVHLS